MGVEIKEKRLRGARGSPELEGQPDGRREGRGGSRKAKRPSTKGPVPLRTRAPPRSTGAWPGTDRKIAKITWRAGYGGIFILTGREHPSIVAAASRRGEGSRKRRAARDRLAGYGTPSPKR